ncbi:hypothetical protein [Tumebacillus flagellatus]|uniref:hypothetical protein n=1 Tax=Tumebacillus flagellatus TaxID=1157490 RepID=UPI001267C259|nr:hypothetical protein [Tumebacillus flagellatus]
MKRFDCGCVDGHYWCKKHDIYTKFDPKDPPPHGVGHVRSKPYQDPVVRKMCAPEDYVPTSCSCHISAPCSFCTGQ